MPPDNPAILTKTAAAAVEDVQTICDDFMSVHGFARVLDAGCGSQSYVRFDERAHVTGVDVQEAQLASNHRLNERIVADLETYDVPPKSFDIVICWEVIEHLREPIPVLRRLAEGVAPGGFLVVGAPNARSVKGILTRYTPYRFHVWVYRKFFNPEATADVGEGPFPTFLRAETHYSHVESCVARHGFSRRYLAVFESPLQIGLRKRFRVPRWLWRGVSALVKLVSFRRIEAAATDYVLVMRRAATVR